MGSMAIFKKRFKAPHIGTIEEFDNLINEGRPVLVDFYQFGCQPCQVMDGIVNEVAEEFAESAAVVKVNLETVPELFYKFKVKSTPTFLLLVPKESQTHQGWRRSGLVKKDLMTQEVAKVVASPA
jgi:thioredoxin